MFDWRCQSNHSVVSVSFVYLLLQLQKMKQLRAVYPEKTVYTQQVGPGCCFGALALMLRFYFEVTIKRNAFFFVSHNLHNYVMQNTFAFIEDIEPPMLCFCRYRSGTMLTSTASTICPWLCPSSCCCQRRIATQGRDKTRRSSPALRSAAA